jgi:hypothetical protein
MARWAGKVSNSTDGPVIFPCGSWELQSKPVALRDMNRANVLDYAGLVCGGFNRLANPETGHGQALPASRSLRVR